MKTYRLPVTPISALLTLILVVALACNLGTVPVTPTPVVSPTSSQKPVIQIQSPQGNADTVVNKAITVQVASNHPDGVTRVELRANGVQVDSKVSQNPLGDTQLSALMTYTPTVVGSLTLTAIAYRGVSASDPATVTVNVVAGQAEVTPTEAIAAPTVDTDPSCRARVDVSGLNFRQGPGTNYPVVTILGLSTVIHLTGRLGDNTWWQGTYGNQFGWLSANFITLLGFCQNTPIANPPPPPAATSTPTNTPGPTVNQPAPQPDLVVSGLTGSNQVMLSQGGSATSSYQVSVQNIGTAAAGQFTVALTLPDGTRRTLGTVPILAPGQVALLQTNVTFTAPGSARLIAIVDSDNQIAEKDESNNLRFLDIAIIRPTPLPGSTATATVTVAVTKTATPTNTATATPGPTNTNTATATVTDTKAVTNTATPTDTASPTVTVTVTSTP